MIKFERSGAIPKTRAELYRLFDPITITYYYHLR